MMNQYETVFIMTPVLSDQQMKETVEKFKGILTAAGAEIINEEEWGLKTMAYPIQKKSTGFYEFIEFTAAPEVVAKLEVAYRRDERVIRYLTVKNEKFAAEYAAKRRNKFNKKEDEHNGTSTIRNPLFDSPHSGRQEEKVLPFQEERYQVHRLQGS